MTEHRPSVGQARLIDVRVPRQPRGIALVLHGGASRGRTAVSSRQPSVVRMIPVARAIALRGHGQLAVMRLLNSARGWSETRSPIADVAWALDELARRFGEVPVCLVGHSLGGRAALLSAGHAPVRGVVALAPWVYVDDMPAGDLSGTRVAVVHGAADRVARPDRSRAVAHRLAEHTQVLYVLINRGNHAMLRRARLFDSVTAELTRWMLLDEVGGSASCAAAAGEGRIEL